MPQIVCPEIYTGSKEAFSTFRTTWKLDTNSSRCPETKGLDHLVTIAILDNSEISSIDTKYENISVIPFGQESIKTPFVLLVKDLTSLTIEAKLERSLRLLQDETIGVVSGSTKNSTGHWRTNCRQLELKNYILSLQPGYKKSVCDCMICPVSLGSPLMVRRKVLDKIPLTIKDDIELSLLTWFIALKARGFQSLLCPEIMYNVNQGRSGIPSNKNIKI